MGIHFDTFLLLTIDLYYSVVVNSPSEIKFIRYILLIKEYKKVTCRIADW